VSWTNTLDNAKKDSPGGLTNDNVGTIRNSVTKNTCVNISFIVDLATIFLKILANIVFHFGAISRFVVKLNFVGV
jgi:hypothetical protein